MNMILVVRIIYIISRSDYTNVSKESRVEERQVSGIMSAKKRYRNLLLKEKLLSGTHDIPYTYEF